MKKEGRIRVLHVIPELRRGGAELALVRLLEGMDPSRFENVVLSLTDAGALGEKIKAAGVALHTLNSHGGVPGFFSLLRALQVARQFNPDILQSWLYLGDFWAFLLNLFLRRPRVVWNIRCSDAFQMTSSLKTRFIFRLNAFFSGFTYSIIGNSQAGIAFHQAHGYHSLRWKYIPNGFELSPANTENPNVALPEGQFLIGTVSKFHHLKDYETLIKAAHIFLREHADAHLVLVGSGFVSTNTRLLSLLEGMDLKRVHLLGEQEKTAPILKKLSLFTLTSISEGFPNALGEAMSAGLPCVATRVGAIPEMLGATGVVVPVRNPEALAAGWEEMYALDSSKRKELGQAARQRIQEKFSLSGMVKEYEDFYTATLHS